MAEEARISPEVRSAQFKTTIIVYFMIGITLNKIVRSLMESFSLSQKYSYILEIIAVYKSLNEELSVEHKVW